LAPAHVSTSLSDSDGVEMIHQESGVAATTSIRPISSQGRHKTPQGRQQLADIASDSLSSFAPAHESTFVSDPDGVEMIPFHLMGLSREWSSRHIPFLEWRGQLRGAQLLWK
jgi:hypothetical protein